MTEADTFNCLRRIPFRRLLVSTLDNVQLGDNIVPLKNKPLIEAAGWDFEEFQNIALDDLKKGDLSADISDTYNDKWRKWYLSLPPIY